VNCSPQEGEIALNRGMCFELVSVSPKRGGAALNGGMFSCFLVKKRVTRLSIRERETTWICFFEGNCHVSVGLHQAGRNKDGREEGGTERRNFQEREECPNSGVFRGYGVKICFCGPDIQGGKKEVRKDRSREGGVPQNQETHGNTHLKPNDSYRIRKQT